jgi:LysR family transcriptional regulator, regulator for bpeEF and oprC
MDMVASLRVFVRVAERGSFSRAAAELDISPASASAHIAALEKHYGIRLLHRTTRRVGLTADGSELLHRAHRILAELHDADESLRGTRLQPRGALRVDLPTAFSELLLPALPAFLARYPEIELEVRFNDRVVDLVADRIDVAMRVGAIRQGGFAARKVAQMRLVTCASPDYLAAHGEPRTPDELRDHRLIGLISPGNGSPPEWHYPSPFGARRLGLHWALTFNSAQAVLAAAAAGLGITHTTDLLAARDVRGGRLRPILADYSLPGPALSLVYPSAGHQSPKVRVFSDFAAELLHEWSHTVAAAFPGGQAPGPRSR